MTCRCASVGTYPKLASRSPWRTSPAATRVMSARYRTWFLVGYMLVVCRTQFLPPDPQALRLNSVVIFRISPTSACLANQSVTWR